MGLPGRPGPEAKAAEAQSWLGGWGWPGLARVGDLSWELEGTWLEPKWVLA